MTDDIIKIVGKQRIKTKDREIKWTWGYTQRERNYVYTSFTFYDVSVVDLFEQAAAPLATAFVLVAQNHGVI